MVYDAKARRVAIKAIGTVESNMTYDSIYYVDAITVGIAQWYAGKARNILHRMRTENPGTWVSTGVLATLNQQITDHDDAMHSDWDWWTGRYLTRAEGEALRPVLLSNRAIQNDQFAKDIDALVAVAVNQGMDKDNNTQAVLFYCVMEWQGPKYARRVLARAGAETSLDRLLAECLNDGVLGQYRNRYNTAARIIRAMDDSGVEGGDLTPTPTPDPGGSSGTTRPHGDVSRLQVWGDQIFVVGSDGSKTVAIPSVAGNYLVGQKANAGTNPVPPPSNPNPDIPPTAGATEKETAIRTFLASQEGRFAYGQGPTRLTPEKNMYTDCSALLYWAFKKVLGINLGTWTGNQYTNGRNVAAGSGGLPVSSMRVGDLVFFDWRGNGFTSAFDHVEMYFGNGQLIGHGGPGSGPTIKQNTNMANTALRWRVQRVI